MADQFTAGETFTEDEQVTHTKLNLAQTNLKFASAAVDDSTTAISSEAIIVKSGGITVTQLADDAVETAKIKDGEVTVAKLAGGITNAKMAANSIDSAQYVDGSIDKEHLAAAVISGQTEMAEEPVLTQDELLISDNGVLKKIKPLKWLQLPKAYGVVTYDTSTPTVSGALNVASVTDNGGRTDSRRINFTANMASAAYVVVTSFTYPDGYDGSVYSTYVYSRAADHFVLSTEHPEGAGREMSFAVFGLLAT